MFASKDYILYPLSFDGVDTFADLVATALLAEIAALH